MSEWLRSSERESQDRDSDREAQGRESVERVARVRVSQREAGSELFDALKVDGECGRVSKAGDLEGWGGSAVIVCWVSLLIF